MTAATMLNAYRKMAETNGERLHELGMHHPRRPAIAADYRHATSMVDLLETIVDAGIKATVEELTA